MQSIFTLNNDDNDEINEFRYEFISVKFQNSIEERNTTIKAGYVAELRRDGYFHVTKAPAASEDRPSVIEGWKIHISIDNSNPNFGNLLRAWDIVMPILIHYGVYHFKVLAPRSISRGIEQPGKEIVVYEFDSRSNLRWQDVLEEINQQFQQHGILSNSSPFFRCKPSFSINDICNLFCHPVMFSNKICAIIRNEKIILEGESEHQLPSSQYFYVTDDSKNEKYIRQHRELDSTVGPFSRIRLSC